MRQGIRLKYLLIFFSAILLLIIFINSKIKILNRPNIVLIYLDSLRPDHLGCYGYHRNTSPNIDSLAKTGALFKNAFSQSPGTYPSVASVLTSNSASIFYQADGVILDLVLAKEHIILAEVLKDNGYYTMAISNHYLIRKRYGYDQGFDLFDESVWTGKKWNPAFKSSEEAIEKALLLLNKKRSKKFFLFLYIFDPHHHYQSPEPYNRLYDPHYTGKEPISKGNPIPYYHKIMRGENVDLTERDIQHLIALYDGQIKYADTQIGRLLERLRQLNLTNTLVILSSDHGEEFFEHGGLLHCNTLYNELIKVPLVLQYPPLIPQGVIIDGELVQSMDIVPTILDIANIRKPEKMQGESLLPLIKKRKVNWRNYAISESPFVDAKAIVTKKWKYIHHFETSLYHPEICDKYKKGAELYSLEKDPNELVNLYHQEPELAKKLHSRLISLLPEQEKKRLEKKETIEIDQDTKEALRSLGYLQ